jgi:hypothetical protein
MKHKIKILLLFYIFTFLTAVIQSCCHEEFKITSEGEMQAWNLIKYDSGAIGRKQTDTISGEFILGIYFNETIAEKTSPVFINSCYAFTCKESYLNSIDKESISISVDKILIINGDTILPNSNLLSIDSSSVTIHDIDFRYVELNFSNEFYEKNKNSDYLFEFKLKKDDDINLNSSISLALKK